MSEVRSNSLPKHRLLAWPGWRHLGEAYGLGLLFAIWFELIYGVADYITGIRTSRVPVHFQWELAMPFVPAMTVFYMSIFPLFWRGLRHVSPFWAPSLRGGVRIARSR